MSRSGWGGSGRGGSRGVPARGLWRRPGLRWADVVVVLALLALLALLFGLLRLAPALNPPFLPKTAPSQVSTGE